jgi:hypothetical protein
MLNNDAGKHTSVGGKEGQRGKSQHGEEEQKAQSQWAQVVSQVMEKIVSGTNMSTTIEFDNLEVDVPKATGPDGRDSGGQLGRSMVKLFGQQKHTRTKAASNSAGNRNSVRVLISPSKILIYFAYAYLVNLFLTY